MTKRICLACDLKDDPKLIDSYIRWHQTENVFPEVTQSIRDAGIEDMQIFLTGNRLFMIIEVNAHFNAHQKAISDANNPKVQEWENLMSTFQQYLPWAKAGEKWVEMKNIFHLT
ncbi:L-rhamnose mutarotase [Paraferrimonas sp. SM1919]|uniref:L-rhamnose mutarotase n=1 Tax=Paraferrimonas sp. SM1919 TaxID=2662263 RepID=UPI0013D8D15B|nr:L-rhamnose mutarotase [Paraferrimonas sp. SM1919]